MDDPIPSPIPARPIRNCLGCSLPLPQDSSPNRKRHIECAEKEMLAGLKRLTEKRKRTRAKRKAKCKVCGSGFTPQGSRDLYCSDECRTKGLIASIERQRQRREAAKKEREVCT